MTRWIGTLAAAILAGSPVAMAERNEPGPSPSNGSAPVAQVGDDRITADRLDELARDQLARLRAEEYRIKRRVLEQEIDRLVLEREAAARKITVEELVRAEVEAKVPPPTADEVRSARAAAVAEGRRDQAEETEAQVSVRLLQQHQRARRAQLFKELRGRHAARVFLEPVRQAIVAAGPSLGPPDAAVTLVEYSDFQCPFCGRAVDTLKQLRQRYGDRIRVVFRDVPLPFHQNAAKAAEAAACADEQAQFWPMHDKLFANQRALQPADLKRYAMELGLDQAAFGECLDSGRQASRWQEAVEEGKRYGVSGTPAFFVNGRFLAGAQPVQAFAEVLDEELERASSSPVPKAEAPVAPGARSRKASR